MAKDDLTAAIQQLTKTVTRLDKSLQGFDTRLASIETSIKGVDAKMVNIEANMVTRQEFQKVANKIDGMEKNMATKSDLRRLRKGQREIKMDISKLATTTPTIRVFDKLKDKVDRHHPTS